MDELIKLITCMRKARKIAEAAPALTVSITDMMHLTNMERRFLNRADKLTRVNEKRRAVHA